MGPNRQLATLYAGDPADRLAAARALLPQAICWQRTQPALAEALEHLRGDALALEAHMAAMGLARLCSRCAAQPGGGCCSAFMAGNTDTIQMLINLLLGVAIEPGGNDRESCRFLGARGCSFLVKPIFCLNYLCTHITTTATAEHLLTLQALSAAVLGGQTRIESMVLDRLRRKHEAAG